MRLYHHLTCGAFVKRLNRFSALCDIGNTIHTVHVKNTGRLGELLIPGTKVWLEQSDNPLRKTAFDLVAVETPFGCVNIDSQAPNRIFREWAESGRWHADAAQWRSEVTRGDSRFDFAYTRNGTTGFVEVKGVTLFDERRIALFPDAPTLRGVKHLQGLIRAREEGCEAGVCFILQAEDVRGFAPNDVRHPAFGEALRAAHSAGVDIRALRCRVTPEGSTALGEVPVMLSSPGFRKNQQ